MTSVRSVTQQLAGLDIAKKQPSVTSSSTRPGHTKQPSQPNVAKLLTKFAAPNPFPVTKAPSSSLRNPATTTAPSDTKADTTSELDIGRYDGGFEIENEKRGEKVYGDAAEALALDSSVSRYVSHPYPVAPN